jgi:hypothetical protein
MQYPRSDFHLTQRGYACYSEKSTAKRLFFAAIYSNEKRHRVFLIFSRFSAGDAPFFT